MKLKKLKIFIFAVLLFLLILMIFGSCKKTKALENGFSNYIVNISERDQDHYNLSVIYDLGQSNSTSADFFVMQSVSYVYLAITNTNYLYILVNNGTLAESIYLGNSRLINVNLVYDTGSLYLIIYKLVYTTQGNQAQEPIIDGVSRTMLTRYNLSATTYGQAIINQWESGDLPIRLIRNLTEYQPNLLLNFAYIGSSDSVQDINNWVDNQLSNYLTYNNLIHAGYLAGNEAGYLDGFEDGEERGYSDGYNVGYDDGEIIGHANGYQEGLNEGYSHGYDEGYREGWDDGQAGETAITPAFNTLSAIFGGIGSILAVQLVPGVPLGLFFLVPLFFAVLGLILWIWRRN